jgi:type VI protein secretion system component VasK
MDPCPRLTIPGTNFTKRLYAEIGTIRPWKVRRLPTDELRKYREESIAISIRENQREAEARVANQIHVMKKILSRISLRNRRR